MLQATSIASTAISTACLGAVRNRKHSNRLACSLFDQSWKQCSGGTRARDFVLRNDLQSVRSMDSLLRKLGFGSRRSGSAPIDPAGAAIAQSPDDDVLVSGNEFACFGAGCFWGVELAYQRVPGVNRTEVGYTQGQVHMPTYEAVCSGNTGHSEVVRVQYNPAEVSYEKLLNVFWDRHDPTTLNRQGGDVGTQYRSGIYYYTPEQEKAARESLEIHQKSLNRKIVTELLPAKKFYRAESYHQQYLAKGGRMGFRQSTAKGCKDPIRCYG